MLICSFFRSPSRTLTELLKQPAEPGAVDGTGVHHPIGTNGISARTLRSNNGQYLNSITRRPQVCDTFGRVVVLSLHPLGGSTEFKVHLHANKIFLTITKVCGGGCSCSKRVPKRGSAGGSGRLLLNFVFIFFSVTFFLHH